MPKSPFRFQSWLYFFLAVTPLMAQPFVKITDPANPAATNGGPSGFIGASFTDFDGDGDLDLFVGHRALYRNDGNGSFSLLDSGIGDIITGANGGNSWADYDNDGDLDVFLASSSSALYRNDGDGHFTRVTQGAIGDSNGTRGWACVWADVNNDGNVDLFITHPGGFVGPATTNHLLLNDGPPAYSFTRVTMGDPVSGLAPYTVATFSDWDLDGDADLSIGAGPADGTLARDFLYKNQWAQTGSPDLIRDMSGPIAQEARDGQVFNWADMDNDGDFDVYITNWGAQAGGRVNQFYRNDGGEFISLTSAPPAQDRAISLASLWGDYDNDGDLDLYVGNSENQRDRYYQNDGAGNFTELAVPIINALLTRRSGSAGDYDNDGDLDLYLSGPGNAAALVRNDLDNGNHWLNLALVGTVSNRAAIGAKVRVEALIGGVPVWQMREISAQNSFNAQSSLRAHFGLGDATTVETLVIQWPSGIEQTLTQVPADQFLTITESETQSFAPVRRLLYAWISNNADYESILVVNHWGDQPTRIRLTARRQNGETATSDLIEVGPTSLWKARAAEIFTQLGEGSGYTVVVEAESMAVRGRWVTFNRKTATGASPSQGVAVVLDKDTATNPRMGETILFGYLPVTGGFISAPVVVNLGEEAADVRMLFYNESGELVADDSLTLAGLTSLQPFAAVANSLVQDHSSDLFMVAHAPGGLLTGVAFVFNVAGEPAIGNVSRIDFTPPQP